jgi:hypothetical protein
VLLGSAGCDQAILLPEVQEPSRAKAPESAGEGDEMNDQWLTYERQARSSAKVAGVSVVRASERQPRYCGQPRPATEQEIAGELQRRAEKAQEDQRRREFEARSDYQDAKAIRDSLEWIALDSHDVLNRMTPVEWHKLRERLTK